jgi:CDP-4-dehydro-6-deoxyglucose reductase
MPSIKLSDGTSFNSEPGESLLDAASRARVVMAYSCRTGRCSSCKCKVIEGESTALHEELGLSEQEKADGWILSCVRSATSDMSLEMGDLGGLTIPQVRTLPCRIHALERLAEDVIKVVLRLPPTSDFIFLPGQYIDVIAQGGIRRSYSLANASAVDKMLELHVRAVPGGLMSEYWFCQAKVDDLLRLNGPLGTFFLRDVSELDLVFLATGTGIAPVKSMLESVETLPIENKPHSITIYWGGRKPSDLYWDVNSVMGAHRYVPVLSRAGSDWSGARGYVQQVLLAEASDLSETVVYACGSSAMIHSAKDLLLTAGLPEQNFLSDAFVCSSST